jgi:hypothetical protein
LIVDIVPALIFTGDVLASDYTGNAGDTQGRLSVNLLDQGVGVWTPHRSHDQGVLDQEICGIFCPARNLFKPVNPPDIGSDDAIGFPPQELLHFL